MAEEIESHATEPENVAAEQTRRARGRKTPARRARTGVPATKPATARASVRPAASSSAPSKKGRVAKPLRNLVILSMVGGLVATVALPAFAASADRADAEPMTIQQMAVDDAQTFVAASDANATQLSRESYSATTPEEIAKKKAEEAAAERARQVAERAAAAAASRGSVPTNIALTSPGTGEVRWPILNFTKGRGLWDSGYHQGVDLLSSCGTPLYAAAAGVVKVSQESYGGYGVGVSIDHVIGGQRVNTLYGHMTYGSRQVSVGQSVEAGQLIGLVGSTGSSTACHLHFEVHINGSVVDPWAWLQANAG
ncbi:M23 family metallopeptidase [Microbacterium sp. M3]|uniref:M23 family metallopeptidase n=1 Tax=Microbacterium arthrosphaerae TaxID=792652 RepID=A0ABU4GWI8_9MICO|nr:MULTISPECIES: M23 family metallopeptidase [Microbacterium]MDW4571434.1 M23 family metallopeptidase [Microbacterium arthrosphaerae]MDW7605289.1 M23 family metallopeptidase [Microbacterium sp. M3]